MMTIFSLILMGGNYFFPQDVVHEILGASLFVLWALHIVLNLSWYSSLFRGTYRPFRIMQVIVNSSILICAIFLMISGVILSNHLFTVFNIDFGANFARTAHMLASHWYFIFMSLHIGLHVEMMTRKLIKNRPAKIHVFLTVFCCYAPLLFVCSYGIYSFMSRGLWKYLFLQEPFFFLDMERGYLLFFIDYIAIIILLATLAHYLGKLLKQRSLKANRLAKKADSNLLP